jgi:hypothetical protein
MSRRSANAVRNPFVVPALITLASIVGLVSALVGDGVFDAISWLVFTTLVGLSVRAWVKRDRRR